jgi:hypothetical protein
VSSGRVPVLDAARAGTTRLSRPELISDDDAISVSETKKETILEIISFLPWGGDEGIKMGLKRRNPCCHWKGRGSASAYRGVGA